MIATGIFLFLLGTKFGHSAVIKSEIKYEGPNKITVTDENYQESIVIPRMGSLPYGPHVFHQGSNFFFNPQFLMPATFMPLNTEKISVVAGPNTEIVVSEKPAELVEILPIEVLPALELPVLVGQYPKETLEVIETPNETVMETIETANEVGISEEMDIEVKPINIPTGPELPLFIFSELPSFDPLANEVISDDSKVNGDLVVLELINNIPETVIPNEVDESELSSAMEVMNEKPNAIIEASIPEYVEIPEEIHIEVNPVEPSIAVEIPSGPELPPFVIPDLPLLNISEYEVFVNEPNLIEFIIPNEVISDMVELPNETVEISDQIENVEKVETEINLLEPLIEIPPGPELPPFVMPDLPVLDISTYEVIVDEPKVTEVVVASEVDMETVNTLNEVEIPEEIDIEVKPIGSSVPIAIPSGPELPPFVMPELPVLGFSTYEVIVDEPKVTEVVVPSEDDNIVTVNISNYEVEIPEEIDIEVKPIGSSVPIAIPSGPELPPFVMPELPVLNFSTYEVIVDEPKVTEVEIPNEVDIETVNIPNEVEIPEEIDFEVSPIVIPPGPELSQFIMPEMPLYQPSAIEVIVEEPSVVPEIVHLPEVVISNAPVLVEEPTNIPSGLVMSEVNSMLNEITQGQQPLVVSEMHKPVKEEKVVVIVPTIPEIPAIVPPVAMDKPLNPAECAQNIVLQRALPYIIYEKSQRIQIMSMPEIRQAPVLTS